jgi:hypothetical protein
MTVYQSGEKLEKNDLEINFFVHKAKKNWMKPINEVTIAKT